MQIVIDISEKDYEVMKASVNKSSSDYRILKGTPLPENPTNGDMIEAMFPNAEIGANPYTPSVDIFVDTILMMRVDRNWWNAPYKRG